MPYYGDGAPYYYSSSSSGPFANHSSLMSSIGRYHNPIAARYSPHLSTISETPFVTLRRYSPAVPTSATTSLSRPRRIIDTADIDVSKPPSRNLEHRHQQHRLRRDRPTIKIRSQALKDNPALREYNERHEKTVGEMLVEKFLIKDKNAAKEPPRIKLYHQASLARDELSKERENEILAAIRHRITRKMTRRRSSVDAIPLDPEQIEREAALQAAQAEALDTLVAEELAEAEIEVRKGTFTKRHSLVPLSLEISEASESEDEADEEEVKSSEAMKKHATAKKKRRRKSIDKYSQSDDEEEDTFSIAESIIEEEEFEWDDREKCDDIKKIIAKDVCEMKVSEQKRAVSPRMEKKEKLDEVGNRLKELRKEVRKLDKKERDSRGEKKEEKLPKVEELKVDIVKPKAEKIVPKLTELKVDEVKVIPGLEKTEEVLKEEKMEDLEQMKTNIVKPKVEELKKEVTLEKVTPKTEEIKKEPAKFKKDNKKKETEPLKKDVDTIKVEVETLEKITTKAEDIEKEPATLKKDDKMKETEPSKKDVDTIKVEEVTPDKVIPKIEEMKKEPTKPKKDEKKKETKPLKKDLDTVKIEETKILERKDDDKNLRPDRSDVTIVAPAKDVTLEPNKVFDTKDKDDGSKLHEDDTTTSKTTDPALDKRSETPESKLKVKERKVKEKSPKPDRSKLKRTTSAPQQLPPEPESPQGFKVEACNSVGDFSTLYVKAAASAEAQRSIEQFRESIRLPAPKSRTTVETEVVLPVRKPYVRDTSRNSVYLALKPTRKEVEDAKTPAVISEEGENVDRIDDDRRMVVVDQKGSRARDGGQEEFVSWWDDNEDEKVGVKKVEVEKKVEVKESEKVVEKKPEVTTVGKVKVEAAVEKKTEVGAEKKIVTNKITDIVVQTVDKKLEKKTTVDKKITEKVTDPVVEKKTEVKKEKKTAEKIVEPVVEKKLEVKVEKKPTEKTVEPVVEKKLEIKTEKKITEKIVEPVVKRKLEVKTEKKTIEKIAEPVVEKKLGITTEKKTTDKIVEPVVEKKLEVKKVDEQKADIKLDLKLQDKKTTEYKSEVKPKDITIKPRIDDKSTTDKRPKTPTKAAPKEVTSESSQPESQKKSSALPSIDDDDNDKTITRTHDSKTSSDVTHIADNDDEEIIIEASAKRDERKRKVDAAAIMKIEKRILEEAESPDKILTTALPSVQKKEDDEEAEQKVGLDETKKKSSTTEIDFWSEPTDSLQQPTSVESELQQTKNLKLDLTRIEDLVTDDLPTPLVKDQEKTPLVEEVATPLAENLNEVPAVNLQLTEEERRSTVKYNGVKEEEQVDELSGTVKKISKWGNHDNLTSLDSNVTPVASKDVSPAVSTTSSVTKKKIVKKKKSTTTKKTGEGATKKTGESTKKTSAKTKTPVKKTAAATPQPAVAKSSAMSASGSSARSTPVQRPADLQKLFYTTPAILLTATPRDLRKVRRAKAKKKKPPTRTPSLSSDSTGSTRSTATTSTEEGSNCEEDAEQKRLNSTRSNDSGFDGSPRLSTPSQSSENQRNADGDHFHHGSGRITPPATNLPRFKKYEVTDFNFLKVLGKGSFGKVLLAELRGTECVYAVKCLKKDVVLEDDDVECTLIERKVLTLATRHPYLCHLFCTFQTESHLFFVMEYLNGGDLMFHIQKSGRFTEARAKFYAAEIWSGLIFLHKKGIVYRDLKLDNVLLDFEGHIRIADFGMCKLQIFLDRTADTFCGTPDYMAPEIIKGLKYNQAVDWWSFGVLLYEMLTGQSPFSGCDEDELFWSICNERPFIPRYLSQSSTDILVCLLEKDAGKRIPGHEIACHTFFCNIAWDKLERRVLEPPFKPAVEHTLDTRYFDTAFTTERPRLTPVPEEILTSMDQAVFRGFSYTNPNATD